MLGEAQGIGPMPPVAVERKARFEELSELVVVRPLRIVLFVESDEETSGTNNRRRLHRLAVRRIETGVPCVVGLPGVPSTGAIDSSEHARLNSGTMSLTKERIPSRPPPKCTNASLAGLHVWLDSG